MTALLTARTSPAVRARLRWLRLDAAAAVLPGSAFLSALVLFNDHNLWPTDEGWAWLNWASQVQGTGPVAGALACWLVADALRDGRSDWLLTGGARRGLLVRRAAVGLLPALLTLALTGVIVAVRLDATAAPHRWLLAAALSAVAVVVCCGAVGTLVGRLTTQPAAPVVVAVLLWGAIIGAGGVPAVGEWLAVDGASTPLAGFRPTPDLAWHRAFSALVVVAVVVAALELLPVRLWSARQCVAAVAAVSAAVLVIGATGWFSGWSAAASDAQSDPQARPTACRSGDSVRVCVLPENARLLDGPLVADLSRLRSAERGLGLTGPQEYSELTPWEGYRRQDGTLTVPEPLRGNVFALDPFSSEPGLDAALSTLRPPECNLGPEAVMPALVVDRWVVTALGLPAPTVDDPSGAVARFDALSSAQARAWLAAAVPALRACAPEAIPAL